MKRFWLALFIVGVGISLAGCSCVQKQAVVEEPPPPPPPIVKPQPPPPPPPQPAPPLKKDRN